MRLFCGLFRDVCVGSVDVGGYRGALSGSAAFASVVAMALMTIGAGTADVQAETLRSALSNAYKNNPDLDAERARLRATDEGVQRARAGWAPRINGEASIGATKTRSDTQGTEVDRSREVGVQLTQPLFTGFRTYNAVNEAEAEVRAGRAQLRDVEGRLLMDVAEAYLDVIRDRELVQLSNQIVGILTRELRGARTRLGVGEVTRTDVSQTQSRRAEAVSVLEDAKGDLRRSEARYQELVGRPVGRLSVKGLVLGALPGKLSSALALARKDNAIVERALYREQAARFAVSKERSELLPRVDLEAGYQRSYSSSGLSSRTDTADIVGRLMVPLYQGGATRARIRQVKHLHVSRLQEVELARRLAAADLRRAWASLRAARRKLRADRQRVRFVRSALTGVRKEERVGQRTLLDVLNAEEEVFQALRSEVRDRRDRILAHYQVLRAIGRLDVDFLKIAKVQYDPESALHRDEAEMVLNVDWR